MSANDKDVQHSEEPRPEEEMPAPDVPEWDPVAAFGEFPVDAGPDAVAAEVPVVEPESAPDGPAFEMPPPDFALEFDGGDPVGEADAEPVAADGEALAAPVVEPPTDLPDWDPMADFSPESFTDTDSTETSSPVVTETNVFTSASPDLFDIPEPVFEPEAFAADPEPAVPEEAPAAPVASTAGSPGLERVLATIDAEVAVSDRRPAAATATSTAVLGASFVGFLHGGGRYAFSIDGITEITRSVRTTPVPFTPEWVVGVTNLRGDILAVADFGLLLGNGAVASRDAAYMIVLQGKRTSFSLGLLVDAVTGMRMLEEGDILTPTAPLGDRVAQFARGVTGAGTALTVVLDVEAFLALPEMQQFSQN